MLKTLAEMALPAVTRSLAESQQPLPATDYELEIEYQKALQELQSAAIRDESDKAALILAGMAGFIAAKHAPKS